MNCEIHYIGNLNPNHFRKFLDDLGKIVGGLRGNTGLGKLF